MSGEERGFWRSRLRWRLRGAWMWPTFLGLTMLDGLILHLLPPLRFGFSEEGLSFVAGVLIATFGNLFLVGFVAPWLARRLVARQRAENPGPEVPEQALREVMADRVGTGLLAVGLVGVVASGLASIPLINGETDDRNRAAKALVQFVKDTGPPEIKDNLNQGAVETARLGNDYFRSCIPFRDRKRYWCVVIDTSGHPVDIKRDRNSVPNTPEELR